MTYKIDYEQKAREQFAKLFQQVPKPATQSSPALAASTRKVWRVKK